MSAFSTTAGSYSGAFSSCSRSFSPHALKMRLITEIRRTGLSGAAGKSWGSLVWGTEDQPPRSPLAPLHFIRRLPVIRVRDLHVAVLVQVVAPALEHVEALLSEVTMLPRAAAGRNDLHVGVHRLHPRVHRLVDQVLEKPLPRHLPRHVFGMDDLSTLRVPRRRRRCIIQQRLIELFVGRPLPPRFRL